MSARLSEIRYLYASEESSYSTKKRGLDYLYSEGRQNLNFFIPKAKAALYVYNFGGGRFFREHHPYIVQGQACSTTGRHNVDKPLRD